MKSTATKRILAIAIALSMAIALLPAMTAYADPVAITFDYQNDTGAVYVINPNAGDYVLLNSVSPTYPGHALIGWSTTPQATYAEYSTNQILVATTPLILYAVWRQTVFTLSFYSVENGTPTLITTRPIPENSIAYLDVMPPMPQGATTFLGWATSPTSLYVAWAYRSFMPVYTYDIDLYAIWNTTVAPTPTPLPPTATPIPPTATPTPTNTPTPTPTPVPPTATPTPTNTPTPTPVPATPTPTPTATPTPTPTPSPTPTATPTPTPTPVPATCTVSFDYTELVSYVWDAVVPYGDSIFDTYQDFNAPNWSCTVGGVLWYAQWYTNQYRLGVPYDFNDPVTSDITLYAKWMRNWKVTYHDNVSGLDFTDDVLEGNATLRTADAFTRTGWTLTGWWDPVLTVSYAVGGTALVNGNLDLYAVWTQDEYSVTFNPNGAPNMYDIVFNAAVGYVYHYGDTSAAAITNTFSWSGYTFKEWNTSPAGTGTAYAPGDPITTNGDVVLYAIWTRNVVTIWFKMNDGTLADYDFKDVYQFDPVPAPALDPQIVGWTFGGWYTDAACTAGHEWDFSTGVPINMDLFAKWTLNKYVVTFETNWGTPVPADQIVNHGDLVTSVAVFRSSFIFDGWYTDAAFTTPWDINSDRVTGPMTLYAKWSLNMVTVWFRWNDGTLNSYDIQTVVQFEPVDEPTPPPEINGFTFGGWFKDAECTPANKWDFSTGVEESRLLFAKWTGNPVVVSYNCTEVWPYEWTDTTKRVGDIADMKYDIGDPFTSQVDGLEYVFYGWYHDAARKLPYYHSSAYPESILTGDKTLYAKWLPKFITVHYNFTVADPWMVLADTTVEYNPATGNYFPPSKYMDVGSVVNGYLFIGWYDDKDLTTPHDFSQPAYDGLTLFAKWLLPGSTAVSPVHFIANSVDRVAYNQLLGTAPDYTLGLSALGWGYLDPFNDGDIQMSILGASNLTAEFYLNGTAYPPGCSVSLVSGNIYAINVNPPPFSMPLGGITIKLVIYDNGVQIASVTID